MSINNDVGTDARKAAVPTKFKTTITGKQGVESKKTPSIWKLKLTATAEAAKRESLIFEAEQDGNVSDAEGQTILKQNNKAHAARRDYEKARTKQQQLREQLALNAKKTKPEIKEIPSNPYSEVKAETPKVREQLALNAKKTKPEIKEIPSNPYSEVKAETPKVAKKAQKQRRKIKHPKPRQAEPLEATSEKASVSPPKDCYGDIPDDLDRGQSVMPTETEEEVTRFEQQEIDDWNDFTVEYDESLRKIFTEISEASTATAKIEDIEKSEPVFTEYSEDIEPSEEVTPLTFAETLLTEYSREIRAFIYGLR